ncbi:MAG: hypothetical protein V1701_03030 [Planctomycetota bacterium]
MEKPKKDDKAIMAQCIVDTESIIQMAVKLGDPRMGLLPFGKEDEVDDNSVAICKSILAAALFRHRIGGK